MHGNTSYIFKASWAKTSWVDVVEEEMDVGEVHIVRVSQPYFGQVWG